MRDPKHAVDAAMGVAAAVAATWTWVGVLDVVTKMLSGGAALCAIVWFGVRMYDRAKGRKVDG